MQFRCRDEPLTAAEPLIAARNCKPIVPPVKVLAHGHTPKKERGYGRSPSRSSNGMVKMTGPFQAEHAAAGLRRHSRRPLPWVCTCLNTRACLQIVVEARPVTVSPEAKTLLLPILVIFAIVVVVMLLLMLWAREQVKKNLRERGFRPIRVRWRPFAYWRQLNSTGFNVSYLDVAGSKYEARCSVSTLAWPFGQGVQWIENDAQYLDKNLPWVGRVIYLRACTFFLYFGVRNLIAGEWVIPRRGYPGQPHHLSGWPMILLSSAALCGAVSSLAKVAYQYVTEHGERACNFVARFFAITGWLLLAASFAVLFSKLFTG